MPEARLAAVGVAVVLAVLSSAAAQAQIKADEFYSNPAGPASRPGGDTATGCRRLFIQDEEYVPADPDWCHHDGSPGGPGGAPHGSLRPGIPTGGGEPRGGPPPRAVGSPRSGFVIGGGPSPADLDRLYGPRFAPDRRTGRPIPIITYRPDAVGPGGPLVADGRRASTRFGQISDSTDYTTDLDRFPRTKNGRDDAHNAAIHRRQQALNDNPRLQLGNTVQGAVNGTRPLVFEDPKSNMGSAIDRSDPTLSRLPAAGFRSNVGRPGAAPRHAAVPHAALPPRQAVRSAPPAARPVRRSPTPTRTYAPYQRTVTY